ncbi:DUF4129 domain-containing protein [Amycolatopsis nigrescens]|uniref:DUF4129 domain-containing protein n=1 Tax=Amycolatopsis nigrescens TaxID=381445 RepID=UPI001FE1312C|nr:DUF4129 domain-containing protein [Amycolatopsis nigrescens]
MEIPVDIGRDDARAAAERELARAEYQAAEPSLLDRLLRWAGDRIAELLRAVSDVAPGGLLGLLVILVLIVLIVVVIRLRVGSPGRRGRSAGQVFTGRSSSAAEHRLASAEAFARGELDVAVRERFRALVRGLEERDVLDERSGRTADEAATEAGARLPECRDELAAAAARFDEVYYGGHPAAEADYHRLVALDERSQAARPVMAAL